MRVHVGIVRSVFLHSNTGPRPDTERGHDLFSLVVSILYLIVFIKMAFGVKNVLETNYAGHFSGLATFFLHILYLQYKINRLGEPLMTSEQGRLSSGLGAD